MSWKRPIQRLKELSVSTGSLTEQSIVSGGWVAAMNVSDRVLQLAMVIIVARIIGPEAFGLMGIALLTLGAFNRFSRLGLSEALVYNEDENVDAYLNTTLSLNVIRGVIVGGGTVLAAPFVATLFGEPSATQVLRVLALTPLVRGLRNPGIVYFRKHLDFHGEYVYKVSGAAVQFVVAVGYALAFPTVWALVFGTLSKRLVQTIVSYRIHPYRPSLEFNMERAKELVNYGKWMTAASITGFLTKQGDDAFVGWFLGASSLGLYQLAYRLAKAPNTEVTHVVSRVAFPAYAKLQDSNEKLRAAFYRTVKVTLLVAFPAGVGIAVVAPVFVDAFLGEDWLPAVPAMQVLAVYGMSVAFGSMFGELWKAVGRPDINSKISALKIVSLVVFIYPLTDAYGVLGAAMTIVLTELFIIRPIAFVVTVRLIEGSLVRLLQELTYPLAASVCMGATVWFVRQRLVLGSSFLEFVVLVTVGVVGYVTVVALLETQSRWGLRSELRSVRSEMSSEEGAG